ncbi:MAG: ATP synthase F1 subunit gamma [Candidatus Sungbacteria bacterium]|nr:ATP synthase F1 subunit gamma [Candidatus Sungbacteria bacterium]
MPSIKTIKQRIKSVKSTSQITKAMEVVSATKMRRSQEFAIRARPYAVASIELLHNLLRRSPTRPALLKSRLVKKSALLVVTSDKGLAGAFNANVLRHAEEWHAQHPDSAIFTIGKKAREYFERRGVSLLESYSEFGDFTELSQTLPIADRMISGFLNNEWDEVDAVYTNFRTTLVQEATLKKILPVTEKGIQEVVAGILPRHGKYAQENSPRHADPSIDREASRDSSASPQNDNITGHYNFEYQFEPSANEILDVLVPQLIRLHIHHIILESNASEHSARMIAMKNASDNAKDIITDLTLIYNKVRQAGITRELTEITAGKEALEE